MASHQFSQFSVFLFAIILPIFFANPPISATSPLLPLSERDKTGTAQPSGIAPPIAPWQFPNFNDQRSGIAAAHGADSLSNNNKQDGLRPRMFQVPVTPQVNPAVAGQVANPMNPMGYGMMNPMNPMGYGMYGGMMNPMGYGMMNPMGYGMMNPLGYGMYGGMMNPMGYGMGYGMMNPMGYGMGMYGGQVMNPMNPMGQMLDPYLQNNPPYYNYPFMRPANTVPMQN